MVSNRSLQHPFVVLHKVRERLVEPHLREVELSCPPFFVFQGPMVSIET